MKYLVFLLVLSILACQKSPSATGSNRTNTLSPMTLEDDWTSAPVVSGEGGPEGWERINISYQRFLDGSKTVFPLYVKLNSGAKLKYKIEINDGETQGVVRLNGKSAGSVTCLKTCKELEVRVGTRKLNISLRDYVAYDVNLDNSQNPPEIQADPEEAVSAALKSSLATWSRFRLLTWTLGKDKGCSITIVNKNGEELAAFGGDDPSSWLVLFATSPQFRLDDQVTPLVKKAQFVSDGELNIESLGQVIKLSWLPQSKPAEVTDEEVLASAKNFCSFRDNDTAGPVNVELTEAAKFYRANSSSSTLLYQVPFTPTSDGTAEINTCLGPLRFKSGPDRSCTDAGFAMKGERTSETSCDFKETGSFFNERHAWVNDDKSLEVSKGFFRSHLMTARPLENGWYVAPLCESSGLKVYFRLAPKTNGCRMTVGWQPPLSGPQ